MHNEEVHGLYPWRSGCPYRECEVMVGPTESNGVPAFAHDRAAMICRKQKLLITEMRKYFRQKCEEIRGKFEEVTLRLTPRVRGELAGQLLGLRALSNQTDQKLRTAHGSAGADAASFERWVDRTIIAMEHLSDAAEALSRYIDELFGILSGKAGTVLQCPSASGSFLE